MEKWPKLCCPFLCNLTTQSIETYGKINLVGICSHPINANRLVCQIEKWADMGTFNSECNMALKLWNIKKDQISLFSIGMAILNCTLKLSGSLLRNPCGRTISPLVTCGYRIPFASWVLLSDYKREASKIRPG